jgi:superfamily II DNA or RNA helicase
LRLNLTNHIEVIADAVVLEKIEADCIYKNPKHSEALRMGYSARKIPKLINLSTQTETGLIVPIGMLNTLVLQYPDAEIIDKRTTVPVQIPFNGQLRNYQQKFVADAILADGGVLVAATGAGKTISAIALASKLKQRTLVLVKSKDLAQQWIDAIKQFTGLDAGLIGSGKNTEGDQITIGLVQTLVKRDLSDLRYGLVITDECHNAPANQCYTVINGLNSRYKFGLSATPNRRDNLEFMIFAALGNACSEIKQNELEDKVLPVHISTIKIPFNAKVETWTEFQNILVDDEVRNLAIVDRAVKASEIMGTIILCAQVRHCELLASMCSEIEINPLVLHGQLPAKVRLERMAAAPSAPLIIGTLSLLSEGIDLPHLTALIFAAPVSASIDKDNPSATRLIQSIGRCRRPFKGKSKAYVLDIVDQCGFGFSAYRKRKHIYKLHNFKVAA